MTPSYFMPRIILTLLCLLPLMAMAASVTASFEPNPISPGNVGSYTLTIQGEGVQSVGDFQLPSGLEIVGGAQQTMQATSQGGRQMIILKLSWPVSATQEGTFVIPPVQVTLADGAQLSANAVEVVVKAGAQPAPPTKAGRVGQRPSVEPLFQVTPGKTEFYVGEMIPVTASIFVPIRVGLRNVGLIEVEKQDLAIQRFPKNFEQSVVAIENQQYQQITFKSVMSALKPGSLKVGPTKVETMIDVQTRGGIFGEFFGEPRKAVLNAPAVSVKVLPLPEEGKPASFTGAVGEFTFQATTDARAAAVGEPIAVDLAIQGTGNFDAISAPALTQTEGWKLYPPRRYTVDGDDPNVKDLANRRMGFSVMMVAEKPMNLVPAFEFSFFNPNSKQYVHLRSQALPVAITGAPIEKPVASATMSGSKPVDLGVKAPEADITGILTRLPVVPRVATVQVPAWQDSTVISVNVVGLLLLLGWLGRMIMVAQRAKAAGSPELRRKELWGMLTEGEPSEGEFYRRVVHYLHQLGAGENAAVQGIYQRYEALNFMGAAGQQGALSVQERDKVLDQISVLRPAPGAPLLKGLTLLLVLCCSGLSYGSYESAVAALEAGKPAVAEEQGRALLAAGTVSPDVFSLLGHALYEQKKPGLAAVWYQRAWLFPQASAELRQNLRHVSDKLKFLRPDWTSELTAWAMMQSHARWALIASLGGWLALASLLKVLGGLRGVRLAGWLAVFIMGSAATAVGAVGWSSRPGYDEVSAMRFVVGEKVSAHSAASLTSGSVIDVPTGSMVKEVDVRGAWSYIEIYGEPGQNDKLTEVLRGWVKSESLEPVWPYPAELLP